MKFILILLILIIKLAYSATIQFDNTIVNTCTQATPCDLKTSKVWVGGDIPTDGDDIVIDFSTLVKVKNQEIYIVANQLSMQLASFSLDGASNNGYQTSLLVQDSNLNIASGFFKVYNAQVTIQESSDSSNNQIQVANFIANQVALLIDGNTNIQTSNLTIDSSSNIATVIQGSSVVNVTQFVNLTTPINHYSDGLLAFTGNGLILNDFFSNGTIQIHNITIVPTDSQLSDLNVVFGTLFLDAFMIIGGVNINVTVNEILFNYDRHAIYIGSASSLNINGNINNQPILDGIKIIILGNLYLPSGFTISNITPTTNGLNMVGTIIIKDSIKETTVNALNAKYLNIETPGNLTLYQSTVSFVSLTSSSAVLDIKSNSTIYFFNCTGTTNIEEGVSLSLMSSISYCYMMNVYGFFATSATYYGNLVRVYEGGRLSGQFNIMANIISNSMVNLSSYQTVKSITIGDSGSLSLTSPGLVVNGSLTLNLGAQLNLYFIGYNNKNYPAITVNGDVSIYSASLYIETQYPDYNPSNNDRIYLIKASNISDLDFSSDISFSNFESSPFKKSGLSYKVEKDDQGNIYIEFKRSNKTLVVVLCVVIPLVVILGIVLIVILKRRSKHHHHGERAPLNYKQI